MRISLKKSVIRAAGRITDFRLFAKGGVFKPPYFFDRTGLPASTQAEYQRLPR